MWGESQLKDPSRRMRVVQCFEKAFEAEAHRLMGADKPNAIERVLGSAKAGRVGLLACMVVGIYAAVGALWGSGNLQLSMMNGVVAASGCGAAIGVGLYLLPTLLGMDPTRPWWASRKGSLDAGFLEWMMASMGKLSEPDAKKLDFIARVDSPKALHDVWMALRAARELMEKKAQARPVKK
jgi:hypothetical protein